MVRHLENNLFASHVSQPLVQTCLLRLRWDRLFGLLLWQMWSYGMLNVHRVAYTYAYRLFNVPQKNGSSLSTSTAAFWTQCTNLPAALAEVAILNLQMGQIALLSQGHQNSVCRDCDNGCRSMFSKQTVNTVCRAQPSHHGSFWGYRRASD